MGDITIKLKENGTSCEIEYEKQLKNRTIKTSKSVSIEDFVALFQKMNITTSAILPRSCVGWRIEGRHISYYLDFPAQKKTIVVKNRSNKICFYDTIPVPRTLFVVRFDKDNPSTDNVLVQIFALKGTDAFNFNTPKYFMPMLNIFSDGRICWGSNKLKLGKDPQDLSSLDTLYNLFWDSNFNFDLAPRYREETARRVLQDQKIPLSGGEPRFEDLLRALHAYDTFTEDLLVKV